MTAAATVCAAARLVQDGCWTDMMPCKQQRMQMSTLM